MPKPRILIADDDDQFRSLLTEVLRDRYLVLPAVDGLEAIDKAEQIRPDAILLDLSMPECDGMEVLRRIRVCPRLESVPVIVVTGDCRRETVIQVIEAGANDYVLKQSVATDRLRLFRKIDRCLKAPRLEVGPPV
ncbi:MAG: response regulator [Planctomycetaceae bacterium]|nr:response regulator [Planctomycetaceae bacterium]